jgi:phage shock protein PspC (stress-responsive transcriptional regulator)
MEHVNPTPPVRRLERGDGPIGGVAAGLADYFNLDVTLIRLGLVAGTLLGGPVVPICYLAAWAIIPRHGQVPIVPLEGQAPPPPVPAGEENDRSGEPSDAEVTG